MKFDLRVEQKVLHGEDENTLVTLKRFTVEREEFIREYEEDSNNLCITLREAIYMYHYANGYITQLSDIAMRQMYENLKENSSIQCISYYIEERERLSSESEFKRGRTVNINLEYIK